MDLVQLRYFLVVAEAGSFTRAAARLDMAQPSLSRQIRLLEVELRQSLFWRDGRGAVLTEAGELLVRHARHILHQVELAQEELDRKRGAYAGRMAVGLPPALSRSIAAELLEVFAVRLPEVQLSISDGLSTSLQEWLLRGQLDIALIFQPQPTPDLAFTTLARMPMFLIGPAGDPDGPVTLSDLAKLPLVLPRRPHEIRLLLERELAYAGLVPKVSSEVDNIPIILELVSSGRRHTVLPRFVVPMYADAAAYSMRPITEGAIVSNLAIAVSSRRPISPTQQAARKIIEQMCVGALQRAEC